MTIAVIGAGHGRTGTMSLRLVPATPFPHANDTKEFGRRAARGMKIKAAVVGGTLLFLTAGTMYALLF